MIEACGSARRWQPHIKTVKSAWAINALCDAGVRHFKCATPREAELLGSTLSQRPRQEGDYAVLVAYPHTGPTLRRIAATAVEYDRWVQWSVLVEDAWGAERVLEQRTHVLDGVFHCFESVRAPQEGCLLEARRLSRETTMRGRASETSGPREPAEAKPKDHKT